ncbi:MAG: hypothetical protein ACRCVL_08170, partial [Cetobacterium sp.]
EFQFAGKSPGGCLGDFSGYLKFVFSCFRSDVLVGHGLDNYDSTQYNKDSLNVFYPSLIRGV